MTAIRIVRELTPADAQAVLLVLASREDSGPLVRGVLADLALDGDRLAPLPPMGLGAGMMPAPTPVGLGGPIEPPGGPAPRHAPAPNGAGPAAAGGAQR